MRGDAVGVNVLSVRFLAGMTPELCAALGLRGAYRSVGLISTDSDDATYIALDEATKRANVEVGYARSLYAGAKNASTPLAGEVIGILGGESPAEVRSGMAGALELLHGGVSFRTADDVGGVIYLAHCVARTGSYLSGLAGVAQGEALAYLIAPPVEAICGLDAALKAASVRLAHFFAPPSETNFGGGLLTGTQSACRAACDAFAVAVCAAAQNPLETGGYNGLRP